MPSPYAPDEPPSTIIAEETWLQGALLSSLFYGVQVTLSVMSFIAVLKQRKRVGRRLRIILLVYTAVLFALMTCSQGLSAEFIQEGFVTNRNYPGGPSAFFKEQYSTPTNLSATISVVCANWMMEALLVWRCRVVCTTGERFMWLGIMVPSILLIAVLVTGSLFIHNILHSAPSTLYTIAYSMSSLLLNITATGIIAGRLLVYRHRMIQTLGPGHGGHYASIAAMVVESASLYTGFLIVVIVVFAVNSPASNIFQQVVAQVQGIASLLIIFRIAQGKGWTEGADRYGSSAVISSFHARASDSTRMDQDAIHLDIRAGPVGIEPFLQRKGDNGAPERSHATSPSQSDVV